MATQNSVNNSLTNGVLTTAVAGTTVIKAYDSTATAQDTFITATSGANPTLTLSGWNTTGSTSTDFMTITSNTTATCDLNAAVTIGTSYIYRVGGTDVAVADGGTGVSTAPTDGQILIGSTGVGYVVGSITAGSNVTITPGAGSISIASANGLAWSEETGATIAAAVNHGYVCNRGTLITATLPATAAAFSIIRFVGKGAGLFSIAQNANQMIHFGNLTSATGVGGSVTSTGQYDCIDLLCTVADLEFTVMDSLGNFNVVV